MALVTSTMNRAKHASVMLACFQAEARQRSRGNVGVLRTTHGYFVGLSAYLWTQNQPAIFTLRRLHSLSRSVLGFGGVAMERCRSTE